ncbi:MAG: hypothetical protein QM706_08430 [Nitrospira sp.]
MRVSIWISLSMDFMVRRGKRMLKLLLMSNERGSRSTNSGTIERLSVRWPETARQSFTGTMKPFALLFETNTFRLGEER